MMQYRGGKSVYFLLTKWDLLKQQYKLDDIFAWLERKNPQLKQFFENRSSKLRFIPVSVGSFEEKADSGMKRISSGPLRPFGVEMPLAYSILEFFEDEIANAYSTQRKRWMQSRGKLPTREPRNRKEARKFMYHKLYHLVSEFEHNNQKQN